MSPFLSVPFLEGKRAKKTGHFSCFHFEWYKKDKEEEKGENEGKERAPMSKFGVESAAGENRFADGAEEKNHRKPKAERKRERKHIQTPKSSFPKSQKEERKGGERSSLFFALLCSQTVRTTQIFIYLCCNNKNNHPEMF